MLLSIATWLVSIYAIVCILFYFLQDYFFFRPELLPHNFQYKYPFPFEELHFDMDDGGTINGIYFKVPNSLGVIFYLKGNSKSIKGWGKFAKDFVGKGYDFFMIDYRGFGKSKGRRSEQILYSDAQHIYKWLNQMYTEDRIVVYGRSFGSGVAAKVASWNNPSMLILDSPYYSFERLIRQLGGFLIPLNLILKYRLPTYQFIQNITCPIHIIHGIRDKLIPFKMSRKLKVDNPQKIQLHPIRGAGHNNLPSFPLFHESLYSILTESIQEAKAGKST